MTRSGRWRVDVIYYAIYNYTFFVYDGMKYFQLVIA